MTDRVPPTPMRKEIVQPTVAWATVRQLGTPDLAPRMILAPATMPSLPDREPQHGAMQVLVTVPLPGVACPTAETSVISTMPQHQVETTLLPLRAPTVLLLPVLLRRHLARGPTVLPRLAEFSVLPLLVDCPSVEATMPQLLRPLTHQLLPWAALLLPQVRVMAMTMVVLDMMRALLALNCFLISPSLIPSQHIEKRSPTQHSMDLDIGRVWGRLHICILFRTADVISSEQPQLTFHWGESHCEFSRIFECVALLVTTPIVISL